MSTETLACTYAAIMLSDAGVPATADNLAAACKAANIEVRETLPIIFARFLEKKSVESLVAAAAAVAPVAAAPAAAAGGAAAPAGGKGKKEEVIEEEGDDDMGFGLFD